MMRTLVILVTVALTLFSGACGSNSGSSIPSSDAARDGSIDLPDAATTEDGSRASCPTESDTTNGSAALKIGAADYWRAAPTRVNTVTIWLRAETQSQVPGCPGEDAADARCGARDVALLARQRENADQIGCVLDGLGFRLSVAPVWYESPLHLTSGQPVPVVLAFNVGLDWSQIERVAGNPLVSRIDPPPGGATVAAFVPPVPAECPTDGAEDPKVTEAKVAGIAAIDGKGRQPVVVETADQGLLPAMVACDGGDNCAEATNALWERTILNTRELTCLKRRLDQLVAAASPAVPYVTVVGNLSAPSLPPLGQPASTLKAFGVGLTLEEGQQLARHPYVERLWTSSGIQFEQSVPGCPPDLTAPIPVRACPVERTSISGKISDADQVLFSGGGATRFEVIVLVDGGAHYCPLEACSQSPCPAREAVANRYQAENLAAQRCVRALIESEGGASSAEVFSIVNAFVATLNWEQIQAVAAHPHVVKIEANIPTPPP